MQLAVYAKLAAALSPIKVYDEPPSGAVFPYLTIGDDTIASDFDKVSDGHSVTVTLHAWSRDGGRRKSKEMLATAYAALHDQPLAVSGHGVTFVYFSFAESFQDADGKTWHGVARYRINLTS